MPAEPIEAKRERARAVERPLNAVGLVAVGLAFASIGVAAVGTLLPIIWGLNGEWPADRAFMTGLFSCLTAFGVAWSAAYVARLADQPRANGAIRQAYRIARNGLIVLALFLALKVATGWR